MAGLFLDPWQEWVLTVALGERSFVDPRWAAPEIGICVPRQNGKGALLEARQLVGLFLLEEELQIHSAHEYATSMDAYRRLKGRIKETAALDKRVKRYIGSHGEEGIELHSGQRIWFRTRTKGGGRGFACDTLYLDEAMKVSQESMAALIPTLATRPNSQIWYTGSAVDQLVQAADGIPFARIRERGIRGENDRLAYFEWSVDAPHPDDIEDALLHDREARALANPGYGIRIFDEDIDFELGQMGKHDFAVERLGIGDWPRTDGLRDTVIDPALWDSLKDESSTMREPYWLAFDVTPDRRRTTVAGASGSGPFHVEVAERKQGTDWVAKYLVEVVAKRKPQEIFCDSVGPAASLVPELEQAGLKVTKLNTDQHAQACGMFFDTVAQKKLRHLGTSELASAIRGSVKRPLLDRWAWDRGKSDVDISPLVAVTLALWGAAQPKPTYRSAGF
jgi:hypothetical protein